MFLKAGTVWNLLKACAHLSPSPALSKNLGGTSHTRGRMSGSADEDVHTFPVLVVMQPQGSGAGDENNGAVRMGQDVLWWCGPVMPLGRPALRRQYRKEPSITPNDYSRFEVQDNLAPQADQLLWDPKLLTGAFGAFLTWEMGSTRLREEVQASAQWVGTLPRWPLCTQDRSCPVLQACGTSISPLCC